VEYTRVTMGAMNKTTQLRRLLFSSVVACIFGAAFWLLTELGQAKLTGLTGGDGCCQRCTDFLYNSAQPVLAFCAGAAYFCQSLVSSPKGRLKRAALKGALCWLCFQIFSAWTVWHLFHRTPCTALYSPGHVFVFGPVVVMLVLLIESSIWMAICALMILTIEGIKAALRKEDEINLSIRA